MKDMSLKTVGQIGRRVAAITVALEEIGRRDDRPPRVQVATDASAAIIFAATAIMELAGLSREDEMTAVEVAGRACSRLIADVERIAANRK